MDRIRANSFDGGFFVARTCAVKLQVKALVLSIRSKPTLDFEKADKDDQVDGSGPLS